ncbi:MAG: hypothetical protein ABL961_12460, partial [Vicinamibacterales bacterium]
MRADPEWTAGEKPEQLSRAHRGTAGPRRGNDLSAPPLQVGVSGILGSTDACEVDGMPWSEVCQV